MLEIDGIPPRLTNQVCEELFCQQYRYRGKVQQEIDVLLLKINGRWHQLYFDEGIVFWRIQADEPRTVETQPGDPFSYPLIDLGQKYRLKQAVISDCITEPLLDGARLSFIFEHKGTLIASHCNNMTALRFIKGVVL